MVATALLAVPAAAADAVTVPGASVDAGPVHVQTPPVTVNPPVTHTPVDPVVGGVNNTANHVTSQVPTHVNVPLPSPGRGGSVPTPTGGNGGGTVKRTSGKSRPASTREIRSRSSRDCAKASR